MEKEYLGDGAYADYSTGDLRLFTTNGLEEENEIFLDGDCLTALFKYVERCLKVKITIKPEQGLKL
jgi:hypothetical protein